MQKLVLRYYSTKQSTNLEWIINYQPSWVWGPLKLLHQILQLCDVEEIELATNHLPNQCLHKVQFEIPTVYKKDKSK